MFNNYTDALFVENTYLISLADKQPAKSLRMLSEEAKQPQNSESSTPPSATPEEEVQVQPEPEQEVTTVEAPPAELGLCEFETPKNK
ncbi:hypothetical protein MUA06_13885, partial [Proteus columbae]|nr:hypothetical protein [Proteus columbae]